MVSSARFVSPSRHRPTLRFAAFWGLSAFPQVSSLKPKQPGPSWRDWPTILRSSRSVGRATPVRRLGMKEILGSRSFRLGAEPPRRLEFEQQRPRWSLQRMRRISIRTRRKRATQDASWFAYVSGSRSKWARTASSYCFAPNRSWVPYPTAWRSLGKPKDRPRLLRHLRKPVEVVEQWFVGYFEIIDSLIPQRWAPKVQMERALRRVPRLLESDFAAVCRDNAP